MTKHRLYHKAGRDLPDVHLLSLYLLVKVLQEGKKLH